MLFIVAVSSRLCEFHIPGTSTPNDSHWNLQSAKDLCISLPVIKMDGSIIQQWLHEQVQVTLSPVLNNTQSSLLNHAPNRNKHKSERRSNAKHGTDRVTDTDVCYYTSFNMNVALLDPLLCHDGVLLVSTSSNTELTEYIVGTMKIHLELHKGESDSIIRYGGDNTPSILSKPPKDSWFVPPIKTQNNKVYLYCCYIHTHLTVLTKKCIIYL